MQSKLEQVLGNRRGPAITTAAASGPGDRSRTTARSGWNSPPHLTLLNADCDTEAAFRSLAEREQCTLELCRKGGQPPRPPVPRVLPHFLFIDISELSPGAAELVRCTRRALPDSCIIALAATTDEELVFHSIVAGARGYLVKPLCSAQLARTLQECGTGTPIFSPQAAAALVQRLHRLTPSRRVNSLSAREQEIADCLVAGYQDKDIARSLDISAGTVRSHLVNLFRKLEVHDRRAAIAKVVQLHASIKIGEACFKL